MFKLFLFIFYDFINQKILWLNSVAISKSLSQNTIFKRENRKREIYT